MWLRGDREHLFVQIYLFGININIQSLFRIELLLVGGAFLGDCGIIKFIGTYILQYSPLTFGRGNLLNSNRGAFLFPPESEALFGVFPPL